ncbi:acyltransferase [Colwellia sp. D2M02]|uniref:acyltransferase n=1 Tax=Colwellia sp. D2M02 TaxID=2841562 RepID=UPI001C082FE5|nr:acyltransferase [Colwellia sp. D2M02]MBU2891918.1 acyltransferase [Colwellia sp. D2M02]
MLYLKLRFYLWRILQLITLNRFFHKRIARYYAEFSLAKYRMQGAEIGEGTTLIECKLSGSSKGDRFYIGNNCTLTGVTLLAHDASPTIFLPELVNFEPAYLPGARRSYRDPIHIGDNVFIGWGSIILPGVTIGDNVVIGAGSVVSKNIPENSVAAGNPAKVLKDIESYKLSYYERLSDFPERF